METCTKNGLVYLASPYSAPTALEREWRFKEVCKYAGQMMKKGMKVFCPIAHSHPIEVYSDWETIESGDFWLNQDFAILEYASALWVYKMPGWEKSKGIQREIEFATKHNISIAYIPYYGDEDGYKTF